MELRQVWLLHTANHMLILSDPRLEQATYKSFYDWALLLYSREFDQWILTSPLGIGEIVYNKTAELLVNK